MESQQNEAWMDRSTYGPAVGAFRRLQQDEAWMIDLLADPLSERSGGGKRTKHGWIDVDLGRSMDGAIYFADSQSERSGSCSSRSVQVAATGRSMDGSTEVVDPRFERRPLWSLNRTKHGLIDRSRDYGVKRSEVEEVARGTWTASRNSANNFASPASWW
jgi:hypothetical protein